MERESIEKLRGQVGCGVVLEKAGFAVDAKESTRKAMKFRRAAEIIIVTHEGRGWFDPLGEDKGDVFSLIVYLERVGFVDAVKRVAELVGFELSPSTWIGKPARQERDGTLPDRWIRRRKPWRGSATWQYLSQSRCLPASVVSSAIAQDRLREGPYGSMWAAHTDITGEVCGWEERGPEWRGFAADGAKVLFRLGPPFAPRFCVTEAAIDAMSLAAIEGVREGSAYLSTGGGWSPATDAALRELAVRPGALLVAATDANVQGDAFAERLRALAETAGCAWQRLRPPEEDWNATLKVRKKERSEKKERGRDVPHARRPRQGRLRPAEPALDPADRDAGGSGGVMKD